MPHSVSRPENPHYDDVLRSLARCSPDFYYDRHLHRYTRAELTKLLDADLASTDLGEER
ncbi:hypothetical protein [Actinomyces ruminis]|uniref:hypothetical protein n=1 Tax=Actinomyces ruminis TaxID=1937003 RepID=UPI0015D50CCC|nr:hypothetical protein [Actinomyces ruminis]